MNESSNRRSLAVLSAYSEKWSQRLAQQFQEGVSSLLAEVDLQIEDLSFRLRPVFLTRLARAYSHRESQDSFTYAIFDVTDFDENLAHLLGMIQGAQIQYVAI